MRAAVQGRGGLDHGFEKSSLSLILLGALESEGPQRDAPIWDSGAGLLFCSLAADQRRGVSGWGASEPDSSHCAIFRRLHVGE